MVGLQPNVILASAAATAPLQRETRESPTVFVNVAEAVALSIVPRLDRPSGNITGFATLEASLASGFTDLRSNRWKQNVIFLPAVVG